MEGIPDDISYIKPFILRSEEMKSADPIISYYVLRYAVSLAFDFRKQNPSNSTINQYLGSILDLMESKKNQLGEVPEPKAHYENFITKLFISADNDDRKVGSTKSTAQKFLMLSYFIEAFKAFEELPPDWDEKRIYCKWKAADILKAIKKGEQPQPGGPNERGQKAREVPEEKKAQDVPFDIGRASVNQSGLRQQDLPINNGYSYTPPPEPEKKQDFNGNPEPRPKPERPQTEIQPKLIPEKRETAQIRPAGSRNTLTKEQRTMIDQCKKFGHNALQELEYKNIPQAIIAFQNAIRSLENFNN